MALTIEQRKERTRKWRIENLDYTKEYSKKYREKNRDVIRVKQAVMLTYLNRS